jgi:hypothetical protein
MTVTVKQVKDALGTTGSKVSKLKNGNVMVRRGYFYRNGMDDVMFNNLVANALKKAGVPVNVVDFGDHWAAFSGGATLARSSHFYVELA